MRPSAAALVGLLLVVSPMMGGCLDQLLGGLGRPDHRVSRTPLDEAGWNTDSTFTVQVLEDTPVEVRIVAKSLDGRPPIEKTGFSNASQTVEIDLPDGTWNVAYYVDGHEWETFKGVRVDTTAPEIVGLPTVIRTSDGSALVGAGVDIEVGVALLVTEQDGTVVGTVLPFQVSGLPDGVHVYTVLATDPAGNKASASVQVVSGSATELPAPKYTAGIVARYTTELRLWDLSDLDSFVSRAAARAAQPDYLGNGTGVKPYDPAVQSVVDNEVTAGMTTGEAALALFEWMYDSLDYDRARLEEDDLLEPAQTIDNGGGVCRDLAGLYASLLRGAGIPARLVAGYLAGEVNGFHAWVEFYGGVGPSPWVPVDVSGIDGPYREAGMMQSFAISLPEHLAMRALTPEEEQTDWSTAAILQWSQPGSGSPEPVAPFLKEVQVLFETKQDLCVNTNTFARASRPSGSCGSAYNARIEGFPVVASRVLDYGIDVQSASDGTRLTLSIVYPDLGTVSPDQVVYRAYFEPDQAGVDGLSSAGFREDPARGRADGEIRA